MASVKDAGHAGPRANGSAYRRREPESTLLRATVRAHLKTLLAEVEQRKRWHGATALRGFRVRAVPGLRHPRQRLCPGALRIGRRRDAGRVLVQGSGFCASCTTRRMQGTATHLLDRVLPRVPMRHWVLSLGAP